MTVAARKPRPAASGSTRSVETVEPPAAQSRDDRELAVAALRAVCQDADAPAAARAQAARTLLEMAGALGRHAPPPASAGRDRPSHEMTRDELRAEIARLKGLSG